jgi:hypothetical protein
MQKLKISFLILFLFSFFISCTETVAPVLTGSISGFVELYEEDGSRINDKSGVKVSIEGRNNYAYTNNDGRYSLENVEAGIFNIVFEKEGFGLYKIIAREFVGGGEAYLYNIGLTKLPTFNVTSLIITKTTGTPPYLRMSGNLSNARNYYRYVILFFGKSADVSNDPKNYLLTNSIYVYPDSSSFGYSMLDYSEYFLDADFSSGETVYVASYSASNSYWGTPDPITGRYYFYNVGTSPVKSSFILD